MEQTEVHEMLETLKASVVGFNIDPSRATKAWFAVLGKYSRREVWDSIKFMMENTDQVPTHRSIKAMCDGRRKRKEQQERSLAGSRMIAEAAKSFALVPGANRSEHVLFVCAERAAENWRAGDDNEVFADLLYRANHRGISFAWIDYTDERIRPMQTNTTDEFLKMKVNTMPNGIY